MGRPAPRILIAEDEEALRESLARAARASGYHADTARDGAQAWERLRQGHYDVVVTDLRMPRVDGPALMGRMREAGLGGRVIVITGHASLEVAVDCLRKGAVDFLVKPFEVEAFLGSVENALPRAAPPDRDEPDWEEVAGRYRLTRRQAVVLQAFYATGKTNRDLAEDLCLSPHTVKSHLKAAFLKVGVTSRAQLLRSLRGRT